MKKIFGFHKLTTDGVNLQKVKYRQNEREKIFLEDFLVGIGLHSFSDSSKLQTSGCKGRLHEGNVSKRF